MDFAIHELVLVVGIQQKLLEDNNGEEKLNYRLV